MLYNSGKTKISFTLNNDVAYRLARYSYYHKLTKRATIELAINPAL